MKTYNSPRISVILPTYDRAHLLDRAIKSVVGQTYKDFEIIVIDDGSKDNTEDVVKNIDDKRIRYVRLDKNEGAAVARNTGIEVAKGDFIAFQDSDDEWVSQKLEKQMKVFEKISPKTGVVYTDMVFVSKDGKRRRYWSSPEVTMNKIINTTTMNFQVKNIGLVTALMRKQCIEITGSFDEKLPRYIDLDLFIRLSKSHAFYHIKEPLVTYYETKGISANKRNLALVNIYLVRKYCKECKRDRRFLANQYLQAGKNFFLSAAPLRGIYYLAKALIICPLIIIFRLMMPRSLHYKRERQNEVI